MALLLKDCGLEGFRGSVRRCEDCRRATAHFCQPGGWPVCGVCGAVARMVTLPHLALLRAAPTAHNGQQVWQRAS
jgi:hypothetical protein